MSGGVDLHSHVLPGIDDGAPDVATSLDMLRQAASGGTTMIVATPHQHPTRYPNTADAIRSAHARLRDALASLGEAEDLPRVVLGAEVHLDERLAERVQSGELLTLGESRRVLLELPDLVTWRAVEETIFELRLGGHEPVIAHPERCGAIVREPERLRRLVELGCLAQLTGSSLAGDFGEPCRALSERFVRLGWVHVVASDAHDLRRRTCDLGRARRAAIDLVGEEEVRALFDERPAAVLEGREISPTASLREEPDERRQGLLARLRARLGR